MLLCPGMPTTSSVTRQRGSFFQTLETETRRLIFETETFSRHSKFRTIGNNSLKHSITVTQHFMNA